MLWILFCCWKQRPRNPFDTDTYSHAMILFACLPFVYGLLFRSLQIVSLCACETNGDVVSLSATTNFYVSHLVVITYPDCMQESLQFSVNCVGKKSDS
jgi:hypothetical protein